MPIICGRKFCVAEDQIGRNDAVLQDLLVVVDIVQEQVQRGYALDHAGFDMPPIPAADITRGMTSKGRMRSIASWSE